MQLRLESVHLGEIKVVVPDIFEDQRGYFSEIWRQDKAEAIGLPGQFVQVNQSGSVKGVLRGLHFQWSPPMGKLMRVTNGEAFLVAVDIRKGSPTLGQWHGVIASQKNRKQLWAPASFARGFAVLSDYAEIQYLTTGIYNNQAESGVLWNDPAIGIEWPIDNPILSDKDKNAQTLEQWLQRPESDNFTYAG